MTQPSRCRLLALPRELRDTIYENLSRAVCLSKDALTADSEHTDIMLREAPLTNVLCLCKQIEHEYREATFRKTKLCVVAPNTHAIMGQAQMKQGVPKLVFAQAVEVVLDVGFHEVLLRLEKEMLRDLLEFMDASRGEESDEDVIKREWTPMKQTVEYLQTVLAEITQAPFSDNAKVHLYLSFHGCDYFEMLASDRIVQPQALVNHFNESRMAIAMAGRVSFSVLLQAPWCSKILAKEDQSLKYGSALRTRRDGSTYWTTISEDGTSWEMTPVDAESSGSYHGWDPKLFEYW